MTHEPEKDALDALFSEARHAKPGPDLMARVLADAAAVQAEATAERPEQRAAPQSGWLAGLIGGIGGWSAVSGITAAGVVGLAVGLYAPDTVAGVLQNDTVSLGIGTDYFTPDVNDLWTGDGDV